MSEPKLRPQRSAGILLHPTSLPSPYGIGDFGPTAYHWVDTLVRARQKWWQILPLGPTGFGDSPYQSFSSFAGNPYLISPHSLVHEGLLRQSDLKTDFPTQRVDYGPVITFKSAMLAKVWENFQAGWASSLRHAYESFCAEQKDWLDDYTLFMALKDAYGGNSWTEWPTDLRMHHPDSLIRARRELSATIGQYQFVQFLFFRQWGFLRRYANERGVRLIGDVPIFVSGDSVDVWANPDLFLLNEQRRPQVVAGVPPDYFSSTGQLWGNPLYHWQALKATGYAWWLNRLRHTLAQVDVVRLDHFRGFEAYWEVPANMPTAQIGRWVKGPGADFFHAVRQTFGGLPLIAEDLGLITPEVETLRTQFNMPGMRILQFAFGGAPEHRFLPHNFDLQTVSYTGTHDNDTTRGWYAAINEHERNHLRRYVARDCSDVAWDMIRLNWASVADYALTTLQDILSLGSEARMNMPGRPAGNWTWRFTDNMLTHSLIDRLAELTDLYGR